MNTSIVRKQTPEEQELERKKIELAALENELAQRELELSTLQAELRAFELRYLRTVGVKYAELDKLEAEIAELVAKLNPQDTTAQTRAHQARAQAEETARATGAAQADKTSDTFTPPEDLKKLYRDAAKKVHPDLATDETERARRTKVMAEINLAYQAGDVSRLRAILDEWEGGPEAIKGEGVAMELVRIIRKISQVRERLEKIAAEIRKLRESDLAKLKGKVEEAEREGRDLLEEMVERLQSLIARKTTEFYHLTKHRGQK